MTENFICLPGGRGRRGEDANAADRALAELLIQLAVLTVTGGLLLWGLNVAAADPGPLRLLAEAAAGIPGLCWKTRHAPGAQRLTGIVLLAVSTVVGMVVGDFLSAATVVDHPIVYRVISNIVALHVEALAGSVLEAFRRTGLSDPGHQPTSEELAPARRSCS